MNNESKCEHHNFISTVDVTRLTDNDGKLTGFTADVTIKCADCNTRFHFKGLPGGSSPQTPTVSFFATELRAPIAPGKGIPLTPPNEWDPRFDARA